MVQKQVTQARDLHAIGSYGVYGRYRGKNIVGNEMIRPWFCGGTVPGQVGVNSVCAHDTRREAERCSNRPEK